MAGVELASMGLTEPVEQRDEIVQFAEPRRGTYKKLIIRDGRLMGGILLGESSKAAYLLHAFESNAPLPEERIQPAVRYRRAAQTGDARADPARRSDLQLRAHQQGRHRRMRQERTAHYRSGKRGDARRPCMRLLRRDGARDRRMGVRRSKWISSGGSEAEALPGSEGEHELQGKYGKSFQALTFYKHRVLDHLNPAMQEFIARQEMMFVGTADRNGNADASFRAGHANFVKVLDERTLAYPEFRGNGVMSSMGNISENPHVGLMFIDFEKDRIGLHVNGSARIVEHDEFVRFMQDRSAADAVLGDSMLTNLISKDPANLERWVIVSVDEAYMHCSKHIPLMQKVEHEVQLGNRRRRAKGGDYFGADRVPK